MKEAARCLGVNLYLGGEGSVAEATSKVPQKIYLPIYKNIENNFANVLPMKDVKEQRDTWDWETDTAGVAVKEDTDSDDTKPLELNASQTKIYLKEKVNCAVCHKEFGSNLTLRKHAGKKHKVHVTDIDHGLKKDKTQKCSICQK